MPGFQYPSLRIGQGVTFKFSFAPFVIECIKLPLSTYFHPVITILTNIVTIKV